VVWVAHVNYTDQGLSRKHFKFTARRRARARGGEGKSARVFTCLNVREKDLGPCNWHDPLKWSKVLTTWRSMHICITSNFQETKWHAEDPTCTI